MLNVREVISAQDIEMMEAYRNRYAPLNGVSTDPIPFAEVLSYSWAAEKESLYESFGRKLIISKEVEFNASPEEMGRILCEKVDSSSILRSFFTAIYDRRWSASYPSDSYDFWREVACATDYTVLFGEIYRGREISVDNPKDPSHPLKFKPGIKIMKMLRKIADAFDIPGYEEMRLEVSRIIGQTKQEGELCLSIHPMDYMTMSDNDCDWESCMNWRDAGCYRRGTVEMMNSPYVVVAYLRSSSDMRVNGFDWNSKKWRTLLIRHPNAIISIKSYPYDNTDLTREAANMLAELTSENYAIEKGDFYDYSGGVFSSPNDETKTTRTYNFLMTTKAMYNDFGSTQFGHYIIPSNSYLLDPVSQRICYSGDTQCVWCGDCHANFAEEEHLLCYDCGEDDGACYCPECDCALYSEDDIIWVDGCGYCEDCVGDHCGWDVWNEQYVHYSDLGSLYLVNEKMSSEAISISISYSTICRLAKEGVFRYDEEMDAYYVTADTVRNNIYGIRFSLWDFYSDRAVNDYLTRIN